MKLSNEIKELKKSENIESVILEENGEKLVPMNGVKEDKIIAFSKAYLSNTEGSIQEVLVREGVKEKLIKASENLPIGYKLVVWETYTPRALQEYLRKTKLEDISKLPHMTGAGIDVSLADEKGNILDMGTDLSDDAPQNKETLHFEKIENPTEQELEYRERRRILFEAMSEAGFVNNQAKWFHWDYGNLWWASIKGKKAFYGSIDK